MRAINWLGQYRVTIPAVLMFAVGCTCDELAWRAALKHAQKVHGPMTVSRPAEPWTGQVNRNVAIMSK